MGLYFYIERRDTLHLPTTLIQEFFIGAIRCWRAFIIIVAARGVSPQDSPQKRIIFHFLPFFFFPPPPPPPLLPAVPPFPSPAFVSLDPGFTLCASGTATPPSAPSAGSSSATFSGKAAMSLLQAPSPATNLPTSAALSVLYFKHTPETGS